MTAVDPTIIRLDKGAHDSPEAGMCLLEAVAYVAGEEHSDMPKCTSLVLGAFGRLLNDVLPDDKRQALRAYIPAMIGTSGDGLDEARSYVALDWLIRTWLPAFLALHGKTREHAATVRALDPIVDVASAERAGLVVRAAGDAAADVAGDAAGDEVRAAARAAAREAAGDAAWEAVGDAALVAARRAAAWEAVGNAALVAARRAAAGAAAEAAAGAAAGAAAEDAAWDAAWDFLAPTVSELQDSAIELLPRLISASDGSGS